MTIVVISNSERHSSSISSFWYPFIAANLKLGNLRTFVSQFESSLLACDYLAVIHNERLVTLTVVTGLDQIKTPSKS